MWYHMDLEIHPQEYITDCSQPIHVWVWVASKLKLLQWQSRQFISAPHAGSESLS